MRRSLGRDWLAAVGFLAPALVLLGLFVFYPLVQSIYHSFTRWDLVQSPAWVGLRNYSLLLDDPRFWQAVRVTTVFTVATVGISVGLGLALALLVDSVLSRRLSRFYQAIFFVPVMVSLVIAATVWLYVLQPEFGPLNHLLARLGIEGPRWLRSSVWALPVIIGMNVWRDAGYNMILFLAGLQNVPHEYHEAAMIDGANGRQRLRYITLPLLAPTTLFVLVVALIRSFLVFTEIHVLTQGGPADSTLALVYLIWQEGFRYYRAGYSSAIAVVFFLVVVVFSFVQLMLVERRVHYS